ncbi:energy transducer TonB [Pseudoalteromonas sp. SMS1]|uniref:energy transducer TonB n=1 Tax=Pseudoalteromonas sp. SMS1 TaxID=2908894 RepID=UPI001F484573|nr:energy transducer TonB [Pseudoalteromonas sp. SMS1]MCF2856986.1 energy transducer TonB [Pseudoalteromonas sp. SMS1]
MSFISAMLLTVASSQASPAIDINTDDYHIETIKNAIPIKRTSPRYPANAARKGQEGWVQVSYVVNEKGEVESAVVENSSGIASFEKAALRAVKSWEFSPATQNKKPVKQCQNQIQLDFRLHQADKGVSRKFLTRYKKLVTDIENDALENVPQQITELRALNLGNFTEDSYFWFAKSRYYNKVGDQVKELHALDNFIHQGKDYMKREVFVASVARAIALKLDQNKLKSAARTFEMLSETRGAEAYTKELFPYIDKVQALIDDKNRPIWVQGKISEHALWRHELVRNAFTIANIQGDLTSLEVRCANQYSVYEITQGIQWNIPQSWQGCLVFVHGRQGASFNLIETAAAVQQSATDKA